MARPGISFIPRMAVFLVILLLLVLPTSSVLSQSSPVSPTPVGNKDNDTVAEDGEVMRKTKLSAEALRTISSVFSEKAPSPGGQTGFQARNGSSVMWLKENNTWVPVLQDASIAPAELRKSDVKDSNTTVSANGVTISGIVYYSTTPLADIQVDLYSQAEQDTIASVVTDASGAYSFSDVPAGEYILWAVGPTEEYCSRCGRGVTIESEDLQVDIDLPKRMSIISPPDGSSIEALSPTFCWEAPPEADRYTFQLNVAEDWSSVDFATDISTTCYTTSQTLQRGVEYNWFIDAFDQHGHWIGIFNKTPRFTVASVKYQLLKRTASIHPDGRGDYVLEGRAENLGPAEWTSVNWYFNWSSGEYSNIRAWDDSGPLNTSVSRDGSRIDVTVYFRRAVQPGETYHFYLALTIGGMAWRSEGNWQLFWWITNGSPVQESVRGLTLPSNATIQGIDPSPTSQNSNYLEWRHSNTIGGWRHSIDVHYGLPDPNLAITHIEVTQAIQDENNDVPLIANKPTFIRVYVRCDTGCTSVPNVMGTLRGYNASGEELSGSPLSSVNRSITVRQEDWQSQRDQLDRSLNFTLPSEWTTGTITLVAEAQEAVDERTIDFQPARSLNVIYVPIRYNDQTPNLSRIRTGSSWARRIYPTSQINYVRGATLDWDRCLDDSLTCRIGVPFRNRDANRRALLNELTTRYRLVNAYVYGWLPSDTFGGGISDPTWFGGVGQAAFGDDHPTEGRRIFAHELAHLMGRRHTNSPDPCMPAGARDPASDWPYSDARIQEHGLDGYGFGWLISSSGAVINPDSNYDYMSYCGSLSEGNVWTSPWTYEQLYTEELQNQSTTLATQPLTVSQPHFIASGLVYTDDTAILDPIWVITTTTQSQNPPIGTEYCLEVHNASDTSLVDRCFDLNFTDYETGETTNVDGFNLMLPYPTDARRIVLKKGTNELAVQPISNHAPNITVTYPNGGETWTTNNSYTITWNGNDLDGDELTYNVLYSPDGGTWLPIGSTITQTHLSIAATELAGSNNARIRIMASDGVNTANDESDAPFTVEPKLPQVDIVSPEADGTMLAGDSLWLQGEAYDLEDGVLDGSALNWSSNLEGDLGTGSELLTPLSFYGEHTLSLAATDSDGNSITDTVKVLVTFPEDVVADCQVNAADVQAEANGWSQEADMLYDCDGDGIITVVDIMCIVARWGETCP